MKTLHVIYRFKCFFLFFLLFVHFIEAEIISKSFVAVYQKTLPLFVSNVKIFVKHFTYFIMKKIVFLCFVLLIFSSCKEEKTNYSIDGKIDSSNFEELPVYLLVMNQETFSYEKIDSTTIKDSCFFFKGYRDSSALASVLFPTVSSIPVVIEPGNISMSISSDFEATLSGTSLNDSLHSFFLLLNQFHSEKIPILDSLHVATKKKNDSLFNQIDSIDNELSGLMFRFLKNNMSNVLGEAFAYTYINQFEIEEQEVLLNLASIRFRFLPKIQQVIDRIDDIRNTLNTQIQHFGAKNKENKKVNFSDFVKQDKIVLLNFWASWCTSCMEDEISYLRRLHANFGKEDLNIVSVSLDNDVSAWKETIDKHDMKWTQLIDSAFIASTLYHVDVNTVPQSFLINKQGKIVGINLPKKALDRKIKELLKN